jgi:hypothetical protein
MSGESELEHFIKPYLGSSELMTAVGASRLREEEMYGSPEAWKARLPNMVAAPIPSEVLDLLEALNTTDLALSEEQAKQLLIKTYENGEKSCLASIPFWEGQKNPRMVESQRQSARADRTRAEEFRTGVVTVSQAIAARREERKNIFPDEPWNQENLYLHLRDKPLFRGK